MVMTNQQWIELEWKKNPAKALDYLAGINDIACMYCECEDCTVDGDCQKAWQNWLGAEHEEKGND